MLTRRFHPEGTNLFALVFFGVAGVVFAMTYLIDVLDALPGVALRHAVDAAIIGEPAGPQMHHGLNNGPPHVK